MNKVNFIQTDGFPLDCQTLDFMQKSFNELQGLTGLGGDNVIISGCTVAGANTTDGVVVIGGELLPFRGGLTQSKVVIVEERETAEFEEGDINDVYYTRYATFGTSEPNISFASLTRLSDMKTLTGLLARVEKLERYAAPFSGAAGGAVLWMKPANLIPAGWREVVDLRGRMPVGLDIGVAEFNQVLKYGGSRTHQNTLAEMVPHTHTHDDTKPGQYLDFGNGSTRNSYTGIETETKTTGSTGGEGGVAKPYSIMNPFRIVVFIEPIPEGE